MRGTSKTVKITKPGNGNGNGGGNGNGTAHPAPSNVPSLTSTVRSGVQFGSGVEAFKSKQLPGPGGSAHSAHPHPAFVPKAMPASEPLPSGDARNFIKGFTSAAAPAKPLDPTTAPPTFTAPLNVTPPLAAAKQDLKLAKPPVEDPHQFDDLLHDVSFEGFSPSVHDQVFSLAKYPADTLKHTSAKAATIHLSSISTASSTSQPPVVSTASTASKTSAPALPVSDKPSVQVKESSQTPLTVPVTNNTAKSIHRTSGAPTSSIKTIDLQPIVRVDESYSLSEKLLVLLNVIIFCGILFTLFLFGRVYFALNKDAAAQVLDAVLSACHAIEEQWTQAKALLPEPWMQSLSGLLGSEL